MSKTWWAGAAGAAVVGYLIYKKMKGGETVAGEKKLSYSGLQFIASFEGFKSDLYNDAARPANATIGYGHLVHRGPINGSESAEFKKGISRVRGIELLKGDVAVAEAVVNDNVTRPLTQAQFDSLVSFAFNVGEGTFKRSSVLTAVNAGDFETVIQKLNLYVHAGKTVLPGLVSRRQAEATAFA